MRRRPLLALAALLAAACAADGTVAERAPEAAEPAPATAPAHPAVGLRHPPLPAGDSVISGALLPPYDEPTHGVDLVIHGGERMVWLNRMTARDAEGRPAWEVRAVLPLRPLAEDETLVLAQACTVRGREAPEVIAIARMEDAEWLSDVRDAWRADTAAERFVPLPVRGVSCLNEGWGV